MYLQNRISIIPKPTYANSYGLATLPEHQRLCVLRFMVSDYSVGIFKLFFLFSNVYHASIVSGNCNPLIYYLCIVCKSYLLCHNST